MLTVRLAPTARVVSNTPAQATHTAMSAKITVTTIHLGLAAIQTKLLLEKDAALVTTQTEIVIALLLQLDTTTTQIPTTATVDTIQTTVSTADKHTTAQQEPLPPLLTRI